MHTQRSMRHGRTPTPAAPRALPAAISLALLGASLSAAAAPATDVGLEEVIVTATRRDATIQDIPYSISALSASVLQDNHVQSLADLTKLIAGVSFVDQGPTSRSNFVLRGINANGTDHPSTNTVAPVSTYVGETPLLLGLHVDDLERVEVLRGPQGTLYGSGSLAGTIRFIPKKPDFTSVQGEVEADLGRTAQADQPNGSFHGMLNLPLSETLALRASAGYQHYAGFINENYIVKLGPPSSAQNSPIGIPVSGDPSNPLLGPMVFSPLKDVNTADLWQARAALYFKPSNTLSALLTYYHQEDRSRGAQAISPYFSGSVDTAPADNPYYSAQYPVRYPTGGVVFPKNGTYDANDSFKLRENRATDLLSADLSGDFGFASITSSTSLYKDKGNSITDNTGELSLYPSFYGFLPRMVDYQANTDTHQGLVQELRLVSSAGGAFDYVVGLFYQHLQENTGELQWIPGQTLYGTLVGNPGGNADTLGDVNVIGATKSDFKDRALFGELTYHLTPAWQVTGGARVFKQDFTLDAQTAFPFCGSYCGDALGNTAVQKSYAANDHIMKLNTAYKVSHALNLYANYAEGFRRGGSTGIPTTGPFAGNPALLLYTPDKTKNFEVGAKGTHGRLNYSAAVFLIDWQNFQVDATALSSGIPIAVNGAKARSKGVELELGGPLLPRLNYQFGFSYAKAQVAEDFQVYDLTTSQTPAAIVSGRAGDPLPNAPTTSATFALDYTQVYSALPGWDARWHLNGAYRSATTSKLASTDPAASAPFAIRGFALWDAAVTLRHRGGLSVDLYTQNLFNQLGITGGQDRGTVGLRAERFFIGRPRTVGLRIRYQF